MVDPAAGGAAVGLVTEIGRRDDGGGRGRVGCCRDRSIIAVVRR